jgi:hypothetical protein
LIAALEQDLPAASRRLFADLAREPLCSQEELRAEVERHFSAYGTSSAPAEFVDLAQTKLVARIWRLLHAMARLSVADQHLVQAAVRYFILAAEEELGDEHGDDAAVIAAVEAHLGPISSRWGNRI